MPVKSYKDLIAWQKAMALTEHVYAATKAFPKEEIYGLTAQMRRSAVSIVSNIAEGQARQSRGELLQFLGHFRGSLAELETQTILATRLSLLPAELSADLLTQINEVARLLNGLRKSLMPRSPATSDSSTCD